MPDDRAETRNYRGEVKSIGQDTKKLDNLQSARDQQKAQDTTGLGKLERKSAGKAPPKAAEFGGDMKAYGEALRKYRMDQENDPEAQAKKRGLARMSPK